MRVKSVPTNDIYFCWTVRLAAALDRAKTKKGSIIQTFEPFLTSQWCVICSNFKNKIKKNFFSSSENFGSGQKIGSYSCGWCMLKIAG